jgi:phospholipid transport system substrate-binding protein
MKNKFFVLSVVAGLLGVSAPSFALSQGQDFTNQNTSHSILLVSAEDGAQAKQFVSAMGDKAISFLSNSSLTQSQKESEFRKLLNQNFDMATIGRFALGTNWKNASDKQKAEYQKLFNDMIVKIYSGRFNDYKGEGFDVASFQDSGKSDVLVTSYIVPHTGSKIQVDWRVRNKNGQYKIIDVIIEGVSMSLTQRSDFSSVIQRGGGNFEVLLEHLRNY